MAVASSVLFASVEVEESHSTLIYSSFAKLPSTSININTVPEPVLLTATVPLAPDDTPTTLCPAVNS